MHDEEPTPTDPPEIPEDVPEADALEQRQAALPEEADDEPDTIPEEAPEADALEQARAVPTGDEADPAR